MVRDPRQGPPGKIPMSTTLTSMIRDDNLIELVYHPLGLEGFIRP